MKYSFLIFFVFFVCGFSFAQPFRYIRGNEYDRDSIKLLKIKSYKEYTASFTDSTQRTLSHWVEYDTNGNLIRNWRIELKTGRITQNIYLYSPANLLLEQLVFYPDTTTRTQGFSYKYDVKGNQIKAQTDYYANNKISSSTRVEKCYDSLNHVTELWGFNTKGEQTAHYEYIFDVFGRQTEELVFSNKGVLLYRRDTHLNFDEPEILDGLPMPIDPFFVEPQKETVSYNPRTGLRTTDDGHDKRIFNSNNIILFWSQKNNKYHWFEYTFY